MVLRIYKKRKYKEKSKWGDMKRMDSNANTKDWEESLKSLRVSAFVDLGSQSISTGTVSNYSSGFYLYENILLLDDDDWHKFVEQV